MKATKPINDSVRNQLKDAAEYISEMFIELSVLRVENSELREKLGMNGKDFKPTEFDCLAVTNVQVFPFRDSPGIGHIKALAQVVLNDQFTIRGLRVMDGENGLFVAYPVDPFFKGESLRSICNPVTRQLRENIESAVIEKYQSAIV